jgi:Beta-propeller repeat
MLLSNRRSSKASGHLRLWRKMAFHRTRPSHSEGAKRPKNPCICLFMQIQSSFAEPSTRRNWLAAQTLLLAALACLALAGCGVSAPRSGGPPPPPGGTGFTTAASTQLWLRQFGTGYTAPPTNAINPTSGIFNSGDILTGIAADPSGNILISGYTFGAFPGYANPDHVAEDFIAKFDPSGNQLWLQQFSAGASDYLNAITTDAAGNIYAGGLTTGAFPPVTNPTNSPEAVVVKLDPKGNTLWLRQFASGSGIDVRALTVDGNGALLLAGVFSQQTMQLGPDEVELQSQQAFAAKLNAATGQTIWQQTLGTSRITILNAIASDAAGNTYLAGEADAPATQLDSGPFQLLAMKLSASDGSKIWQQQTIGNSDTGEESFLKGIAVDPQGNAIVSGIAFGGASSSFLAKLSSGSGEQVWFSPFGAATATYATNVALDSAGNVLVTGTTYAALLPEFLPFTDDVFLAKFNANGQNIWLQQFGTEQEENTLNLTVGPLPVENAVQVTVDAYGNAIVGGITYGQFPGFSNPNRALEPFVAKFNP